MMRPKRKSIMYGKADSLELSGAVVGRVVGVEGIGRSVSGVSDGMSAKYDVSYETVVRSISRPMMRKSRKSKCAFDGMCPTLEVSRGLRTTAQADTPIPTKSKMMDRPCAAPRTACVHTMPKLNSTMRKNQNRKVLEACSSRGLQNCHWTVRRQRNAQIDGDNRNERVCSWYSRVSS